MARIKGVDIPNNKRVVIALTYIYGIGRNLAKTVCAEAGVNENTKSKDLTNDEVIKLRSIVDNYKTEGDLRREISMNIKTMKDIGCYRGLRHRQGLPVRGQRTSRNCRTRKGKRVTVANKKK